MSNNTTQVKFFREKFYYLVFKELIRVCQLTKDKRLIPDNDAKDVAVLIHTY
jgi:hypothetical protein